MDATRPRTLTALWFAALGGPLAWALAFGWMLALVDEACVAHSRAALWPGAGAGILLAALPGLLAWRALRRVDGTTGEGERTRFMLGLAIGGSAIFLLVMLLTSAPLFLLAACRT